MTTKYEYVIIKIFYFFGNMINFINTNIIDGHEK